MCNRLQSVRIDGNYILFFHLLNLRDIFTGRPVSPESPLTPRLPRFPGGPGGPAIEEFHFRKILFSKINGNNSNSIDDYIYLKKKKKKKVRPSSLEVIKMARLGLMPDLRISIWAIYRGGISNSRERETLLKYLDDYKIYRCCIV